MFVGFGMAEIVSAVPTSGGPYFWAAILAPKGKEAFASWITGWYANVAGVELSGCQFLAEEIIGSTSLVR